MNTTTTETPLKISGSMPDQDHIQASLSNGGSVEISDLTAAEQLIEKRNSCRFLESKEVHVSVLTAPAPPEKPPDIPSLLSKLSSLLPRDRQLERRARKLAWQLSKGRRVTCEWDYIFLSELTPAEQRISEDDFLNLYPDHVERPTKKGGRPRKYRTAKAQKKGHSDCQRRYRERKLLVVSDVTKTPRSLLRNTGLQMPK
jgi:hypothetical protein